jgi:hypothetical protein
MSFGRSKPIPVQLVPVVDFRLGLSEQVDKLLKHMLKFPKQDRYIPDFVGIHCAVRKLRQFCILGIGDAPRSLHESERQRTVGRSGVVCSESFPEEVQA